MNRRTLLLGTVAAAASAALAACGAENAVPTATARPAATAPFAPTPTTVSATVAPATTGAASASAPTMGTRTPTPVKVAFSYIPNVQFAPFYVAEANKRFDEAGVRPTFEYGSTTDFMTLVARGEYDFLNASGDEVVLARAMGLPVVYIAAIYQQYPVAVFAPAGKGLTDAQSLTKLRVGLPGFFGATYIGYKAILYAAKIDEKAVNAQEIGFTQVQSVQAGKVDAAVGYANNEPVQLRALNGGAVDTLRVADVYNLPSAGIVTSEKLLRERPEVARAFLRGLIAGMRDTQRGPAAAFDQVLKIVPEAAKTADVQQKVLTATIELCGDPAKYGTIDPALWNRVIPFMRDTNLLKTDVKPETMFSAQYLP